MQSQTFIQRASALSLGLAILSQPLTASEVLNNLIVTGTRSHYSIDKLPDTATVFKRADIELSQAKTIPELLKGTAGIDIINNGGFGALTNISMRGTNSGHVLVLVDGLKVSSATSGTTAIQHFPIDQVERIEIVRGPHSSVYGSEAIGGVIQIFTRKGRGEPTYTASIGAGTDSTYDVNGTLSGSSGDSWYSLAAAYFDTRGYNAQDPSQFLNEQDDDGYENGSITARVGHKFNDNLEVEAFALRAEGEIEFDGTTTNFSETVQQVIGASLNYMPTRYWETSLRIGETQDQSSSFSPAGVFNSNFDTRRRELNWQNSFSVTEQHSIVAGLDYHQEEVESSTNFTIEERDTTGLFLEYLASLGKLDLVASVRNDNTDSFGSHRTGRVGVSFGRFGGVRLLGSYGTGFKEPTYNDLHFPLTVFSPFFTFVGNPNLRPETSRSFELGMDGKHGWGGWSLRAYRTFIRDLVAFSFDVNTSIGTVANVNKASINGMEAEFNTQIAGWDAQLALSMLNARDTATGNRLPRRADRTIRFDLSRRYDRWLAGATLLAQGDRFDDTGNTTPVDGYAIMNLRGEYSIDKNWSLSAHLNNLTNKQYETINGFNEPGRYAMVYVNYRSR